MPYGIKYSVTIYEQGTFIMQKEDVKFADSCVFEGMTSIRAVLRAIDDGINDRRIEKILFDKEKIKKIHKELGYLKAVSTKYGYKLMESSKEELDKITLGTTHGGLVAIVGARTIPCLTVDTPLPENAFYAMIEGIEDPYNFGYSLRSLYAMGCSGIILPKRNWLSAAGVVARSSAGASELFCVYESTAEDAVKIFKNAGYTTICADENTDNLLGKCDMPLPLLLIVGGEKRGISRAVLDSADLIVKIDYAREFKASLSAASATTMFAYEINRQNKTARK